MASTNEGLKPWFYRAAYDGVQTLVWRLVSTEQVEDMQLCCKRRRGVQDLCALNDGKGGDMGRVVG